MTSLENLNFESLELNSRKQIAFGVDSSGQYFIKVEIESNPGKEKNLDEEYVVIKDLNSKGCQSCPTAHELGSITKESVLSKLNADDSDSVVQNSNDSFRYMIQDYVPHSDKVRFADIVFSILEQKSLGVYQGDIKPANLRFNRENSVCYIIDYDQAIELNEETRSLPNLKFFEFCSEHDKSKFGIGNWLRHFNNYNDHSLANVFRDGSFELGQTTIFNKQKTTNSVTGFYHSMNTPQLFIEGSRTLDVRAEALDKLQFKKGETVLDVGCNAGLLCEYLHDRGCLASGFDNDSRITVAAKMVYNILGKDINFFHLDLDEAEEISNYDTVMLFSVLHHTRNVRENAIKIAEKSNRIILESKLIEIGKQPYGDDWVETSGWKVRNVEELVLLAEELFPGFKLRENLGQVDKHRYMLEFVKEN
jgi:SAM-dependent methyltransferase